MEPTLAHVLLLLSSSAALSKYVHITERTSWLEARDYCRQHHTDLAPISNEYDTERLRLLTGDSDEVMWIGLQRSLLNRSEWTWSGGGGVSTFFWEENQPNNQEDEDYGAIINYKWHDSSASYRVRNFICYSAVVVRERKTWEEALEHCREHHHDLASVASDTEMLLVQKELEEHGTSARVWMGLRFLAGGWLWVDGQPLAYEAWGGEGKDECPGVKRRCAAIRVTGGTQSGANAVQRNATADVTVKDWEAHDCVERLHFICY